MNIDILYHTLPYLSDKHLIKILTLSRDVYRLVRCELNKIKYNVTFRDITKDRSKDYHFCLRYYAQYPPSSKALHTSEIVFIFDHTETRMKKLYPLEAIRSMWSVLYGKHVIQVFEIE